MEAVKRKWVKVSTYIHKLVLGDRLNTLEKLISLSYGELPCNLKACFLYLGMFPEDFEIQAWELTRMWIGEGFIPKDSISLEETAENYLEALVTRNLVRVYKRRRGGKVRMFRIHDTIRDFCKMKSEHEQENFLQQMQISRNGTFDPPIDCIQKCRRLCSHSNIMNFISSRPYGPIRSFVSFPNREISLSAEIVSAIPAAFEILRVLEVKSIRFAGIPNNMYHLIHLRYLAIAFNSAVLPREFSKLCNIETLIVDTTQHTLDVRADIWKMNHLRHLKTNAITTLPKAEEDGLECETIQTLGTISPQSCSTVFEKARYVKTSVIRGRLAMLMDRENGSFVMWRLSNLEELKLINDVLPGSGFDDPLPSLPLPYQFPPILKSMTLVNTHLDWAHMSVLGLLENLEVLKLKDEAFMEKTWKTDEGGFRNLEVLCIDRTNLVIWKASSHHFPRLRSLQLKNCQNLQEVPIELAEIPTLKMLELFHTSKSAAASARNILEKRRQMAEGKATEFSELRLSILPPDE